MAVTKFLEPGTDATQNLSFFLATHITSGSVASASDQAFTGTFSLKCALTAMNGTAYGATPNGIVSDAGALVSFYARFSTVGPSVRTVIMFVGQATDGSHVFEVAVETTGALVLEGAGLFAKTGATILAANTWYRLSLGYILTSSTNWSATLYINGVSEATASNADATLSAVTTSGVSFGPTRGFNSGASGQMTAWYDNIYVDNRTDKTDSGNVLVTAKRPFANGTTRHIVVWASEQPTEIQLMDGTVFTGQPFELVWVNNDVICHRQPMGTNEGRRWFLAVRCSNEALNSGK